MLDLEIFAQLSGEDFPSATTGSQVQLSREVKQLAEDEDKLENEFTVHALLLITICMHLVRFKC